MTDTQKAIADIDWHIEIIDRRIIQLQECKMFGYMNQYIQTRQNYMRLKERWMEFEKQETRNNIQFK